MGPGCELCFWTAPPIPVPPPTDSPSRGFPEDPRSFMTSASVLDKPPSSVYSPVWTVHPLI